MRASRTVEHNGHLAMRLAISCAGLNGWLGERAWLAARAEAARRPGFDLKRWHTAALSLGPIGLDSLAAQLRAIPA